MFTNKLKPHVKKRVCGPGKGKMDANGDLVRTNGLPGFLGGKTRGKAVRASGRAARIRKKPQR